MKAFTGLAVFCLATTFYSCNNNTETSKEETVKAADTTVAATTPPPPAAFVPFDVAEIAHKVKNYATWRPLYNSDSAARKASGMEEMVVAKTIGDTSRITITLTVSDLQKAKDFAANPRLKEVMEKGGVSSKPEITYWHVIRMDPTQHEKQWVIVRHKVKDFDAWVKVFDGEGPATRLTHGLADVALARSVDDPNFVYIVFDIKDMEKAKARMNDPELKKLMTDGGVEGKPKIEFFSLAE